MKKRAKNKNILEIAQDRIEDLFELAEKEFKTYPERSHKAVGMARKIAMRYNIQLNKYAHQFCAECYAYLVAGRNAIVRVSKTQVAITIKCEECGHIHRHPYRREKAKKKIVKARIKPKVKSKRPKTKKHKTKSARKPKKLKSRKR